MTQVKKWSRSVTLVAGLVTAALVAVGAGAQQDMSGALARVSDSVFTIKTDKGQGTGFVVSPEGQALTCRHVVADAGKITITLANGNTTTAEVVASDADRDLALLKLARTGLPSVTFGSSDDLKSGADVAAVGSPLGLENSITKGVVSSPSREVNGKKYLQISAQLNPGNSGGPVINNKGEVVGIANAVVKEAAGVGFAIPSAVGLEFLAAQKVTGISTGLGVKPAEGKPSAPGSEPSASLAPPPPPPPPDPRELAMAIWPVLAGVVVISLLLSLVVSSIIAGRAVRRLGGGGYVSPLQPPMAPWGPAPGAPPAAAPPPTEDLSDIDITLQ